MNHQTTGRSSPTPLSQRRELREARAGRLAELTRQWQRIGNLRLGFFALVAGGSIWWISNRIWLPALLAGVSLGIFIAVVIWHRAISQQRKRAAMLFQLAQEDVWRLERDWAALPFRSVTPPDASHPYAGDLDLFGRGSLMHLLDTTVTPIGQNTLARWLLSPAEPEQVRDRQEAVRELAGSGAIREELAIAPQLAGDAGSDPAGFLEWATGTRWLVGKWWLRCYAVVSPLLLFGAGAAQLGGVLTLPLWLIPLAANLIVAQLTSRAAAPRIQRACAQRGALGSYATLLRLLNDEPFQASLLVRLANRVRVAGKTPAESLGHLARISRWWMPQSSLAWLPAQGFLVWDIHHLGWLERWQRDAGPAVASWLETAGELEALTALAGLAADHPDWVFPDLAETANRIDATGLGHPLLPDDRCVTNDLQIGPPGSFLLVTGSNMSGKSTLLRSVGIMIVMANMGAPVCARGVRLPPLSLWTSVRVQDSLTQGVSFYMAELLRLKQIVDAANQSDPARPLCFILDEMLQGTNTAERQIAARRIIHHLVAHGCLGAVSTHDLTLADGPELASLAVPVHLSETIEEIDGDPAMVFDYRLRPGIATSTNALRLMDVVGFAFDNTPVTRLELKRRPPATDTASPRSGAQRS